MKPRSQKELDKHFEQGKNFLMAQNALLEELTGTFQSELWDCLEQQAFFRLGQKMALPVHPSLQQVITRQIIFTWGLAFAVGSASVKGSHRFEPEGGSSRPFQSR